MFAMLGTGLNVEQAEVDWLRDFGQQNDLRFELVSIDLPKIQAYDHLAKTTTFEADRLLSDVDPDSYRGLMVLNGVIGPYEVRMSESALDFVRKFAAAAKPIYAFGHAPWVLIGAGLVAGRRVGAWPNLRVDVESALGVWDASPIVVDRNLISGNAHEALQGHNDLLADFLTAAT